ncbi:hypothetical protein BGX28_010008 [Mortierella sp. GBA30]|nr:hypothetical protein BGX28_010008 [Mortierella sp. GBA30]
MATNYSIKAVKPRFPSSSPSTKMSLSFLILALIGLQIPISHAHSWLDCSNTLPSGECAGFPIGYPTRANPDINTLYTYLISGRPSKAPVCQPGRQDIFPGQNPDQFPPASVLPGQTLHLTWQANGHMNQITDPGDKTTPRTQVYVYWTGQANKVLRTREELQPGTLLKQMDFATPSNCDQPSNPNSVCNGKITIPKDMQPGRHQLVWWWPFDKNPIGEEYSTCFEVIVMGPAKKKKRVNN